MGDGVRHLSTTNDKSGEWLDTSSETTEMDFGCEVNRVEYQRLRWKLSNQNLNFGDHAIGERSISLFERWQLYKTGLSLQNNDIKTFEICDA